MADIETKFPEKIDWMESMGDRTGRFAVVIDKDDFRPAMRNPLQKCLTNDEQIKTRLESAGGPLLSAPRTVLTLRRGIDEEVHLVTHDMYKHLSDTHAHTFSSLWTAGTHLS